MNSQPNIIAMGIMSGTSADGLDAAIIASNGQDIIQPIYHTSTAYPDHVRRQILETAHNYPTLDQRARVMDSQHVEVLASAAYIDLIRQVKQVVPEIWQQVKVLGLHGQTIFHDPAQSTSVQLLNADELLKHVDGKTLIHDFRRKDILAGGQGAPLTPIFHRGLLEHSKTALPAIIVNIGGVANLTATGRSGELIAFDTGPGNALMDDLVAKRSDGARQMDRDGEIAAGGTCDEDRLNQWLSVEFFHRPPPKSLDRNAFKQFSTRGLGLQDALATLARLTADSIAQGVRLAESKIGPACQTILCGGGARNKHLVSQIRTQLAMPLVIADELGWSAQYIEAQAFAYLAVRRMLDLPASFPTTTGVDAPQLAGEIANESHKATK